MCILHRQVRMSQGTSPCQATAPDTQHTYHRVLLRLIGVQKERMRPEDLFVLELASRSVLRKPPVLKPSACTPLFYNAYTMRDAGACIHTHSQHAVMATLLYPGKEFVITHQEMIKGIRKGMTKENLRYYDRLVVPIVENTAEEEDLTDRMAKVRSNAIQVYKLDAGPSACY